MAYKILDNRDIDQEYSPESENAQSGKAVAQAIANKKMYEKIIALTVTPDIDGSLP